jgi:single stranded DNA-binding protein
MNRQHISTAELVGRLGQDPDLRYTDQQVPYTQLSVATSERYTTSVGEIREKTEWHRAVAWGEVAESIARDFKKGDALALSGALRINSYEKDGVKHRTTELNVERADRSPDAKLSKNEARLVGIVREDAKARTLDSGTAMTLLSVATTTVVNGKDREDWHSITLWGKTAEAARDIKAGDMIAINGSLRHRTVGDDGQERKLSAIDCRQFEVLERSQHKTKDVSREREPEGASPADAGDKPRARQRSRSKGVERDM